MTNATNAAPPWPTELRVSADRAKLTVAWDDGGCDEMTSEYLRVFTPSAERTGHGARTVIGGKRDVRITDLRPVGRYAVRIVFSDGHDTGLYSFPDLHTLARDGEANFAAYEGEIAALGLSRERSGSAPAPAPHPAR